MTTPPGPGADWRRPIDGAPNFTLGELCRSQTAMRRGIANRPDVQAHRRLTRLARVVLQPLRDHFGPVLVTSGYRCEELNRLVGGSPRSHHRLGQAADLRGVHQDASLLKMLCYVYDSLPFDELAAEYFPSGWVHVAYSGTMNPVRRLLIKETGKPFEAVSIEHLCRRFSRNA